MVVLADEVGQAVHRRQSVELVVGDAEGGVGHPERAEEALREEVAERLVGDDLDQAGGDVDADGVVESVPRLEAEWQRAIRSTTSSSVRAGVVHHLCVAVELARRVVDHEVVREATGVGQHVTDRASVASWSTSDPSTCSTFAAANAGQIPGTGWSSWNRPSSCSSMSAVDTIGFVIE